MRLLIALASLAALVGCGSASNDPREMARSLARDSIDCTMPSECCAVIDQCKVQVLLVSSTDRSAVEVLLGEAPQDGCARCMVPPVQVDCREGQCVAMELVSDATATTAPALATENHCGPVTLPTGWSEKPASAGAGAGLAPATIIGCGE
ncbi:MAG: hypothetical protein HY906_20415 [Deltaproteobacteria bacterium]|nr:hypothetical protein [Deltaproteobacteria bacterium]